ncbi:MAG TPA: hypothetical protein ENF30_02235 [Candidatus Desulfofervidus auxilii]|uniref:Core-binding (CB) domain-containing protein n=1 Tax=Desulfofervidus auxilii TaxID=1621989 RepID=A0A7V0IAA7_DESA2|nr:hypothetical protein [Candidatus Desulfofervidus auxilii]
MRDKYLLWSKENKAFKTYQREEETYRLWIRPEIGDKPLKDISPFDLERIKKNMKEAGRAVRIIQMALQVIRQAFNKATLWGIYEGENPVTKIKKPKKITGASGFYPLKKHKPFYRNAEKEAGSFMKYIF